MHKNQSILLFFPGRRRQSTFDWLEQETDKEEEEDEERIMYRKTFLEPEENEGEEEGSSERKGRRNKELQLPENKILRFITYLAVDHECLLQVLMLLPLTLMALYIIVVEGGDLVIVKKE